MKLAGDAKLVGTVDMHEGRTAIQRNLESLEEWPDRKLTRANAKSCTREGKAPVVVQAGD